MGAQHTLRAAAMQHAAAAFTPSSISGLQIWLKDSGLSGADGASIGSWTNEGVGATTVAAFTNAPGSPPTLRKAGLGGRDAVEFASGQYLWSNADISALFPTAASFFIVFKAPGVTYTACREGANDSYFAAGGVGYMGQFRATRIDGYPAAMPTSGNHYFAVRSSSSAYQAWIDGAAQSVQAANYGAGDALYVGTGAGLFFGGVIAEVLAYSSALSDANVAAVNAYLAARFGL